MFSFANWDCLLCQVMNAYHEEQTWTAWAQGHREAPEALPTRSSGSVGGECGGHQLCPLRQNQALPVQRMQAPGACQSVGKLRLRN